MQSKLLVGGKTIQDHTSEQEKQLEIKRRQLAEERKLERRMQQQLLEREESTNVVHETYSSLRQEVEDKTKKLKKVVIIFEKFSISFYFNNILLVLIIKA